MANENIDKNEFLELEILNQVEKSPKLSNRMLAAHLGCNIRLTHSLLKKLVGRGWLEVKKLNSRNWHYFLTPSGISEKAQRTYRFFEFSMQFYQEARKRSSEVCSKIAQSGKREVAFIGCGNLAEIVYLSVQEWELNLIEVYGKSRKPFLNHTVKPIETLEKAQAETFIFCIYATGNPLFGNQEIHSMKNIYYIFNYKGLPGNRRR